MDTTYNYGINKDYEWYYPQLKHFVGVPTLILYIWLLFALHGNVAFQLSRIQFH